MSRKKNTSLITGKILKTAAIKGMIPGGICAALVSLLGLMYGYERSSGPIIRTAVFLFVICVLVAVFLGWLKANRFKTAVANQEKDGTGRFDEDVLRPITADGTAWLGGQWLLLHDEGTYTPLNRAHIVSCDGINERREGMKKLWLGIVTDKGERPAVLYGACEPDALAVVSRWLQPPGEEPSVNEAPLMGMPEGMKQESSSAKKPEGDCPFCLGPNDPGAEVCQWCGRWLK